MISRLKLKWDGTKRAQTKRGTTRKKRRHKQWPKHINGDGKQNGQLSSCTNLNQNIACEIKIANGNRPTQQHSTAQQTHSDSVGAFFPCSLSPSLSFSLSAHNLWVFYKQTHFDQIIGSNLFEFVFHTYSVYGMFHPHAHIHSRTNRLRPNCFLHLPQSNFKIRTFLIAFKCRIRSDLKMPVYFFIPS